MTTTRAIRCHHKVVAVYNVSLYNQKYNSVKSGNRDELHAPRYLKLVKTCTLHMSLRRNTSYVIHLPKYIILLMITM